MVQLSVQPVNGVFCHRRSKRISFPNLSLTDHCHSVITELTSVTTECTMRICFHSTKHAFK